MCSFGISRTWVGAFGSTSRNARTESLSWSLSEGISPATILQNRHVSSNALMRRTLPRASQRRRDRHALARRLTARLRELLEEAALGLRRRLRRDHLDVEEQVAATAPTEVRNALPLQSERGAGLCAGADVDALGALERRDLDLGAERGLHHRDLEDRVQIDPLALEQRVLTDDEREVEVAARTAALAGVTRAGDPQVHPVAHACGDVDRNGGLREQTPVAVAPLARRRDLLAGPLALRTCMRGHHGAEHAAPDVLDLTRAVAA